MAFSQSNVVMENPPTSSMMFPFQYPLGQNSDKGCILDQELDQMKKEQHDQKRPGDRDPLKNGFADDIAVPTCSNHFQHFNLRVSCSIDGLLVVVSMGCFKGKKYRKP